MTKRNDGKHFEKKAQQVLSRLNPTQDVVPDVRIKGMLSESSRQLDVILKDPKEYDFIAFECKDEAASIGTPTVEAYYTKLMDVRAKRGAIVSNSPFSRGARRMAEKLKIDLLHLVDTEDPAIKTQLSVPVAVVQTRAKTWGISFSDDAGEPKVPQSVDYSEFVVRTSDGRLMSLKELANEVWQPIADDVDLKDGRKEILVKGLVAHNGELMPAMYIALDIERIRRKGFFDITQSEGIYNVHSGDYQTSSLASGPFSADLFNEWPIIREDEIGVAGCSFVIHTRSDLRQGNHPV